MRTSKLGRVLRPSGVKRQGKREAVLAAHALAVSAVLCSQSAAMQPRKRPPAICAG
jgi:hypothetical protein